MAAFQPPDDSRRSPCPRIQPVSWRSVIYGTPVVSSDGARVGQVHEMLGDDAEDIFHGIRVALADVRRDVMIPEDMVESLAADEVRLGMASSEVKALPAYDEEATYHLASVGWLRRHLGWKKDSRSDEEPG